MKTAISLSDETFARAERAAKRHGMNRSQFYAAAADRYAAELEADDVTDAINDVVDAVRGDDSSTAAVAAGRGTLESDEW